MEALYRGRQSLVFPKGPVIAGWASAVGKMESEGPLAAWFDLCSSDNRFGEDSWEKAETRLQKRTLRRLLEKTGLTPADLRAVFSGDLLNQCIGSSFALRNAGIPVVGLYGACSTMAEALLLAAAAVNAGYADRAAAMTSSHFAASERQYRFPLNYGGQRTPTAQRTVTGCGAVLIAHSGQGPRITAATLGAVTDKGLTDANNMGAAMAWAAHETLRAHFADLDRTPEDYDLILTGDLGRLGSELLRALFAREGTELGDRSRDCGELIFDPEKQDVHCGGSGCGCSAAVLCSWVLGNLAAGKWRRILFAGTGALLSPVSVQQKQPIPAICHAVVIEAPANEGRSDK